MVEHDVIVVGAGAAGLSSAVYLSRAGLKVLLCEKEEIVGGLLNSFKFKGFTFDGGIRAVENSGIVFPMLKQLGIDLEFVKNTVSIGIEDSTVKLVSEESLSDYAGLLIEMFPESRADIEKIISEVSKVMRYMDVLYGIDNPLFRDLKSDKEYLFKTLLPWLVRYRLNINKISKLSEPIETYLKKFTDNNSLISIISQHFFKETPAFFALSYFSLYLDYSYPRGGTGVVAEKLEEFIRESGGHISLGTEISKVDVDGKTVETNSGDVHSYSKLIWAADSKRLYTGVDIDSIRDIKVRSTVKTPSRNGLSSLEPYELSSMDKEAMYSWLERYYSLTTYEISCPAVRDRELAPRGQTGLIVSTLMDYKMVKHIDEKGLYEDFKSFSEKYIENLMTETIFPKMRSKTMDRFSSTPLTIERLTGNSDGAITGWAFTNPEMPAENSFREIAKSVNTKVPDVLQAGQWSFSPSGLPVSMLTGKLAADKVIRELK